MDYFALLKEIMLPNRDNGSCFTDTRRMERIDEMLAKTPYRRINFRGLYFLYAKKPLAEIEKPVLLSTHIDHVMDRLFSADEGVDLILGTYDNCITNAAALALMLEDRLPDNVLVAFTGDEECGSRGANDLARHLTDLGKVPLLTLILDVTDMGWEEKAPFTVENNFFSDEIGQKVILAAEQVCQSWRFVPSDPRRIPSCIPQRAVIPEEAEADESWDYDEHRWNCLSLCLPVSGNMHGNMGVWAKKSSFLHYLEAIEKITHAFAER